MTTSINPNEVISQAVVGALTVSIMASAMGVMLAGAGASAYTVKPSELKGTQAMLSALKQAYGNKVVDDAVQNVGYDNALALAQEVERLMIADMTAKYGLLATTTALAVAPPGDVTAAHEIAKMLAERAASRNQSVGSYLVTSSASEKKVVANKVKKVGAAARTPCIDTKTGIQYKSHYAAGKATAAEYGLDPTDTRVWFAIIKRDPTRFKNVVALSPNKPVSQEPASPPVLASGLYEEQISLREAMKRFEQENELKQQELD